MTVREIAALFEDLELRLIESLKQNLTRHKAWEQDEGFSWSAWQAEKLRHLWRFRRENAAILGEYAEKIDSETRALLKEQFAESADPDQPDHAFFGVNGKKLDALIDEMTNNEQRVERASLRYMDDVYRKTILRAATAFNAGGVTMQQATDMATKDFLERGINCIQYRNGRMVNIATYAEMALRTCNTRAMLLGEAQRREELGIDTVLVSQYGGCSETCLPWQGLVYIDDVWQPYHGESNLHIGGSYGQSRNGRSYLMLSVAVKAGLFHPNCRHHLTTWIEGVSQRPEPMDKAEVERTARLEKRQRALERRVRKYKRLAAGTMDPENAKEYRAKVRDAQKAVREFVGQHGDVLRRDYWRERDDGTTVFTNTIKKNILNSDEQAEGARNMEIKPVGSLDLTPLQNTFGSIRTDKVIVTNERIDHIKGHHPEDYALFEQFGTQAVENPDFIIQDTGRDGTIFSVLKLPKTNLNVVIRLVLDTDNPKHLNSVITFYRIREKNLRKLIAKHKLLYKRE